jgi:hypothetical protein
VLSISAFLTSPLDAANFICSCDSSFQAIYREFGQVGLTDKLSDLARIFDKEHFALVTTTQKCYTSASSPPTEKTIIFGVISRIDLLNFITNESTESKSE